MELCKEIQYHALANGEIHHAFPGLQADASAIVEGRCFQALQRIVEIIHDDTLCDCECFMKIEEIICSLEEIGVGCGGRHDFG